MDKTIQAKRIVTENAGNPQIIKKELKRLKIRYVKTQRNSLVKYILRGKDIPKTIVKI